MKKKPASMNLGTTAGFALLAAFLLAVNAFSQNPDPNFYIFLAFGQSNMEGYPNQQQHQDSVNVPARFQLLPAVTWPDNSRKQGTWTAAIPPLCRNTTGLCPCDYFGRTLVDSLPATIKIGIINVAVAGCAIENFDKDKYQSYLAQSGTADWLRAIDTLYGINAYARLVQMGQAAQKDGVIKGILLHQGESGAMPGDTWANEVKIIYKNLIKDLSLDSNKIPLLAGDLTNDNSHSSCVWKLNGPPKVIKNVYVISSDGCGVNSTNIHFSAAGYRALGKNYADSMLVAFRKLGTGTPVVDGKTRAGYAQGNGVELKTGSASISFEIPQRAFVTLKAYTLSGKEVAELAGAEYAEGKHTLEFGRKTMRTGVYVLKMKAGTFSATRTILVGAQ
jgi:hypothetical protein